MNIKPKHVIQSLQVDVAGYGSLDADEDLEQFEQKGGIYELTVSVHNYLCSPVHHITYVQGTYLDGHPDDVRTKTRPRYYSMRNCT